MLKRGRLRRTGRLRSRSTRNSKPWQNIRLRAEYMLANGYCELERCGESPVDPHHICAGNPKVDNVSNLIAVCRKHHDWCQHEEPILGKLLCWERKLEKGELVESEVDRALRQRVRGWLDSDKVKLRCEGTKYEETRMWILESLDMKRFGESED